MKIMLSINNEWNYPPALGLKFKHTQFTEPYTIIIK